MGNVGNVGTKNFQKDEKKPGTGPGSIGRVISNLIVGGPYFL